MTRYTATLSVPLTARGTARKVAPYVHWTQKRGAKAKLARAAAKRARK